MSGVLPPLVRQFVRQPADMTALPFSCKAVPRLLLVPPATDSSRYGCLPLVTPSYRREITVKVSEQVPCRANGHNRNGPVSEAFSLAGL